jgi:hypothetical protein
MRAKVLRGVAVVAVCGVGWGGAFAAGVVHGRPNPRVAAAPRGTTSSGSNASAAPGNAPVLIGDGPGGGGGGNVVILPKGP